MSSCVCVPLIMGSFGRCQPMGEHGQGSELPHSASLDALVGMVPTGIGHDGKITLRMMFHGQEQGPVLWKTHVIGSQRRGPNSRLEDISQRGQRPSWPTCWGI